MSLSIKLFITTLLARFYFVKDEDLLEIIGSSKNIPSLQRHFKNMFAGVAKILLDKDDSKVLGLSSKEGEEVGDACFYYLI